MSPEQTLSALILAGRREAADPVATAEGVSHKCLVQVAGKPIIEWVIDALEGANAAGRTSLCCDPKTDLGAANVVAQRLANGRLDLVAADSSPVRSVLKAANAMLSPFPLLIVSSDSALLDSKILRHFCDKALACEEDILIGVARETDITRDLPPTKRTYMRFADGGFSGCNLFMLRTPHALRAIAFWIDMERHRKTPWKLACHFGPTLLLSLLARRWTFAEALSRIGARLQVTARPIIIPFARAAVDVDKLEDLELVRRLRSERHDS